MKQASILMGFVLSFTVALFSACRNDDTWMKDMGLIKGDESELLVRNAEGYPWAPREKQELKRVFPNLDTSKVVKISKLGASFGITHGRQELCYSMYGVIGFRFWSRRLL